MGILDFLKNKPVANGNDTPAKGKLKKTDRAFKEMEQARDILNAQGLDTTGVFPALDKMSKDRELS